MMMTHFSLFAGLLVGFSVAAPLGPMGVLCIQRTLACGMRVGLSTGLGAATVNVFYAALIVFGLDKAASLTADGGRLLSFAGGVFLLYTAARTWLRRRTMMDPAQPETVSPLAAYASALTFNATNPMSPMLMLAMLSPIVGPSVPSFGGAVALLLGIFTGASIWWICLSGGVALLRSRLGPRMFAMVNEAAGATLTIYGVVALARSAGL